MEYVLENDFLRVTVNSTGAEVVSVYDKQSERECWWHGDPQYWAGHSPILFPACGGLWNGEYHLDGKTYKMPKHGFVRKAEWEMMEQHEGKSISFRFTSNDATMQLFPYRFVLTVFYILEDNSLACYAHVENLDDKTMHYQIGGHPAFALPDFAEDADVIGFLMPDNSMSTTDRLSVIRAGEQGCCGPERFHVDGAVEDEETGQITIPICRETFAHEALIFDNSQLCGMHILRKDGSHLANVEFDGVPACLVWQPQGLLSPFVCVEPWFGLPDRQGYTMDLDYRPYAQHVMPGDKGLHRLWSVEF